MAQTNGITVITVYHGGGDAPASIGNAYNLETGNPRQEGEALSRFFAAAAGGVRPCKVRVRTDSAGGVQAALTLAVTQANIAAGEYLTVVVPGIGGFKLTAVASDADVTAGEFVSETSDAATATNMAAAVNGMLGLKDLVTATTNSGDLIITANEYGTIGNSITTIDGTTNGLSPAGGALSGGKDASSQTTAAIAITHVNLTADDTVTIGTITFTAKASGATGNEFNIGADATADAVALAAAINASSSVAGLVTAEAASGTVTLTYTIDPRAAEALCALSTSDATAFGLTQPASTLTFSNTVAERTYALGAP